MRGDTRLASDIIVGGILSSIFFAFLVFQIISSGVGRSTTLVEFLSIPGNVLFCLLMSMFIFASWIMRGMNNRMVLFCWAIMYVVNYLIYIEIYQHFTYSFKNIYMLCMAGVAASIPVVIVMRHRVFVTVLLLERVWLAGILRQQIGKYLKEAATTDFELYMKRALYVAFSVEFLFSLYMTSYGLFNQISHHENITNIMQNNKSWDPHELYYGLLECITVVYIIIIGFYLYRDNHTQDAYAYGLTERERREAGLKLLEKYREKAKQKEKNRRS